MKILIVEDDLSISSFIERGLREAGFETDQIHDGQEAVDVILNNPIYDLIILDLMLPRLDGMSLLNSIRERGIQKPVIILSAKRSMDDKIKGLQQGGDDYITKPFSFSELLVRIQVLLRRTIPQQEVQTTLSKYGIKMDLVKRLVTRDGTVIELQPKEFNLLEIFLRNPERVLSKTLLLEYVYSYQFDPQTNIVDVLVCRLRNKIDKNFDLKTIHTIRGAGYVLKLE